MNIKRVKSIIEDFATTTLGSDYSFLLHDNSVQIAIHFKTGIFKLSFSLFDYGQKINIQSPKLGIRINAIEEKIESVLKYPTCTFFTVSQSLKVNESLNPEELENNVIYEILDEQTLESSMSFIVGELKEKQNALTAKYGTSEKLFGHLQSIEYKDYSTILTNQSNTIFYRAFLTLLTFDLNLAEEFYKYVMENLLPINSNKTFARMITNMEHIKSVYFNQEA